MNPAEICKQVLGSEKIQTILGELTTPQLKLVAKEMDFKIKSSGGFVPQAKKRQLFSDKISGAIDQADDHVSAALLQQWLLHHRRQLLISFLNALEVKHRDGETDENFLLDGERPKVYVGKLAHGSYHSNEISGWMVGTPHHCCYYADYRNPKESTTWDTTHLNLVSLRGTSESWMHADHIGSPYAYNGSDYLITGWRWGPHISYCNFGGGCCSDWEHNMACSTHPTVSQLGWIMGSCNDEGCGTNNCEGLVYTHGAYYNQGWPWD